LYGFTVKYVKNFEQNPSAKNRFCFIEKIDGFTFVFENFQFQKFENDKIFKENQDFIIGIDGIVLNLNLLKKAYGISSFFDLIIHLYQQKGSHFFDIFKGEFCGFLFDKTKKELYFFNNKTATKQIFYSQEKTEFIVSNSFHDVLDFKNENTLNENAVFDMLSFGGMLENKTFVNSVYKLLAGEYIFFKKQNFSKEVYYDYNQIPISIFSKKDAIEKFDVAFKEAVVLEYEKDKEYQFQHFSTLSGGLDSRMTLMLSQQMNYLSKTFCFSQTGYADQKIAAQIAKDLNLEHEFIALNGSRYLLDLEKMVSINAGLQNYNGSAHYSFALEHTNLTNFGLIHTGQIGDGLLGGLVTKDKNYLSKITTSKFLDKVQYEKNYRDEEIFKLYNRVFNLTNFGSLVVEAQQTYLVSPFFDSDVMEIGFSIDPKLKYNQNIYIDWINQKHPETTKFVWERTGFKPNSAWKTEFSRYTKKLESIYLKLAQKENLLSMTPDEYWFLKDKNLQSFYENFFNENIELFSSNVYLYKELKTFYKQGNLTDKSNVLTILEAVRQFGIEV